MSFDASYKKMDATHRHEKTVGGLLHFLNGPHIIFDFPW